MEAVASLYSCSKHEDNLTTCGGLFYNKYCLTYQQAGVNIHTVIMGHGADDSWKKIAYITDAYTGEITDEFYGSFNDFNLTLLAKASSGCRFFLFKTEPDDDLRIFRAKFPVGLGGKHHIITIRSNDDGEWELEEWREMKN